MEIQQNCHKINKKQFSNTNMAENSHKQTATIINQLKFHEKENRQNYKETESSNFKFD